MLKEKSTCTVLPFDNIFNMSAEGSGTVIKRQKSKCFSCLIADAKYKCPACSAVSCSCACVKAHKQKTGCTGISSPALAVSIGEMNDDVLLRDYRFLEKIQSKIEAGLRDTKMHHLDDEDIPQGRSRHRKLSSNKNKNKNLFNNISRSKSDINSEENPKFKFKIPNYSVGNSFMSSPSVKVFRNDITRIQKRFRYEVRERGTQLAFMPRDMSRHSVNTSHYIPQLKTIRWHVRVEFVQANVYFEDTVDERITMGRIVSRYLKTPLDQLRGWTITAPDTSHTDENVKNINGMESMCKTKGNLKGDPLEDGWSEPRNNNGDSASQHCNGETENRSSSESSIVSVSLPPILGSATAIGTVSAQLVSNTLVSQAFTPSPSSDVISTTLNPFCTTPTTTSSSDYNSYPNKFVSEIPLSSGVSRDPPQPLSSDQSTQMLYYQSAGLGQLAILCKNEKFELCRRYEPMDKSDTLKEGLVGLRIVEHPILLVLRKDHVYEFLNRDGITNDEKENIITSGSSLKPDHKERDIVENTSTGRYYDADCFVDDEDISDVLPL